MNNRPETLKETPEYRLGFMDGHDTGFQKASAFYTTEIRRLTRILEDRGYWKREPKESEAKR